MNTLTPINNHKPKNMKTFYTRTSILTTIFILIIHLGYAQNKWQVAHKTIDVGGYSIF